MKDHLNTLTQTRSGRSRRHFLQLSGGCLIAGGMLPAIADAAESSEEDRVRGLLYGGVLGDAIGGPVEFQTNPQIDSVLTRTRLWDRTKTVDAESLRELAESLPLLSYDVLRPGAEPYGQWTPKAPAGTVTDDTRHKVVLMRMLRRAAGDLGKICGSETLAEEYLRFTPIEGQRPNTELAILNEEGFREYVYAARWLLGERDLSLAKPVERLWAGIDTCAGQMLLPPLAALYPGRPDDAYRAAFALDFVDAPGAKDIAAALVAGLAEVLVDRRNEEPVRERWQRLLQTMRTTDPYGFEGVPFAGRPLNTWLNLAASLVEEASGRPSRLFELLESKGRPVYWWDAHFTILVPIAVLQFCDFNPLAAMHLILDFGHDTDSYAQVLGAMAGAVHGKGIFPESMCRTVHSQFKLDYGEDLDEWTETVAAINRQSTNGRKLISY